MSCAGAIDFTAAARRGWIRRHGIRLVPKEAMPALRAGALTLSEARAPFVFLLIAYPPERAMSAVWLTELARLLELHPTSVRRVTDVLERDRYVRRDGRHLIVARTPGPVWQDYVRRAA